MTVPRGEGEAADTTGTIGEPQVVQAQSRSSRVRAVATVLRGDGDSCDI